MRRGFLFSLRVCGFCLGFCQLLKSTAECFRLILWLFPNPAFYRVCALQVFELHVFHFKRVLDSRFQPGVLTWTVLPRLSQRAVLRDCREKTRFSIQNSYLFIHFVVVAFSSIPWCYCTPWTLLPKGSVPSDAAPANEEVVNWGRSAGKLLLHLCPELSALNRLSTGLNRICSSSSGLLETSLDLEQNNTNKILMVERKIFPLRGIERLMYLLLVVYKLLQKGAQPSTEPGAAHSPSAVPDGHYFWFGIQWSKARICP